MASKTISFRIPVEDDSAITEFAEKLNVDRTTILKRFISEGIACIRRNQESHPAMDWPKPGKMKMAISDSGFEKDF